MNNKTGLEFKLQEMAARIRELRDISGYSPAEMARLTDVTVEEYLECENGRADLNFAFIYGCATVFGVDVTDIIQGSSPRLSSYTLTRNGLGQRIEQAHGMVYYNLAPFFKNRAIEPLWVHAIYDEAAQDVPMELTSHSGQECDIVMKGALKVQIGEHTEILHEGDTIYYNSSAPHGMVAVGGEDCIFYAIVIDDNGEVQPESPMTTEYNTGVYGAGKQQDTEHRVYEEFAEPVEDENGRLLSLSFKNTERFNFAFDVLDALAERKPDKLAMLHVDKDKNERRFTFKDISVRSNRAANYFTSLGIKKGDKVLLVLRRHYQFWPIMMALNKIGAIAILATDQFMPEDYIYRFNHAGISTVFATSDGDAAKHIDAAMSGSPTVLRRIMVNGKREGWHDFETDCALFRSTYKRTEDSPCGDDLMLMYFTSGTSGKPKLAAHNYKYPLGHLITAKYWQCVDPNGLHLTISDTGWAKSMWGKLYGQWLSEAAVFVYDFVRFDAHDILPMFKKYGITTFCAPPTMYRFMIKEDLSKYDLSSIKNAAIAGEALNPEVFHQFRKATGLKIMEGFGQSETTAMIANLVGMKPRMGSMGKPVPIYDVDIVDPDGNPVADGETGEIIVRTDKGAPCGLFVGYYGDEAKNAEAWRDGVYHTGDTAWRDEDGYYWYVGRVDDVIKSSGYRIGPFEIESVIMELPYVLECGVSAAPDEIRGQIVKASIVLTKGTEGTDELKKEIQEYVKKRTAPYKYPRIVVFRDELPKTTSGKIKRNML